MFSINARMFMFLPINYELVSSVAPGVTAITITSFQSAPLKAGQKFTLIEPNGGASVEVELASDQIVLANQPTSLIVQPLSASILSGAMSAEIRHPRTGNRIDQTVLIERWASIELHKPQKEKGVEVQGAAQTIEIVAGRWTKPSHAIYAWPSSDMTMQYQRDNVSIVEGIFKAASTNKSRLNTSLYFGDKCTGLFLTDSRPRVIEGVLTNVCC